MSDHPHPAEPRSVAQPEGVQASRRAFVKAGGAASGVLMTLASKPVLGCTTATSPSGFASGNVSRGTHTSPGGLSPGYWKTHLAWPAPLVHDSSSRKNDGTLFSRIFDCSKTLSLPYAKITMSDLLSHQSFDRNNLGMHCVAAYLNAVEGLTPFLPASRVVQMFNQWAALGYCYPIPGNTTVKWTAAQIVDYLQKTQD